MNIAFQLCLIVTLACGLPLLIAGTYYGLRYARQKLNRTEFFMRDRRWWTHG